MNRIIDRKNGISLKSEKMVVGVGSALVDILLQESEDFLLRCKAKKGGMSLVEMQSIENFLKMSGKKYTVVPGGSACNTIIGIGRLGGRARFIGKCGSDSLGDEFERSLVNSGVEPILKKSSTPTGRVLSIVTPDAQRSMFTFLGASSEIAPCEIDPIFFQGADLVHIEGYLLFNERLLVSVMEAAKSSGAEISLDLASYTIVESSKKIIEELVQKYVDILIANEDEARAYTGYYDENKALEVLMNKAKVAALKVGRRGSFIAANGKVVRVEPMGTGEALDTTGAGDLWAAGFLYGYVNSFPLGKCGTLASACGYEVCQVLGASIPDQGWERIRKLIE